KDGIDAGELPLASELTITTPGSEFERNVLCRLARVRRDLLLTLEDVSAVEYLRRVDTWVPVARNLAHRIKSPLTTMKLLIGQLERRYSNESPATAEDVAAMKEEVDRLSRMTDGFMRMARFDPPQRRPVHVLDLVNRALGRLPALHQSGITVARELPENLAQVLVDEDQIVVALANVVENAIAAMGGKGTLTVRAAALPDKVELSFQDTGPGMSEETCSRVFEPFFTTKRGGTGLGLAITKKIVEDNSGEIMVSSRIGKGTTVRFVLPAASRVKA
ncbi:MAG: ATP-binding protein, partial [candidate division WOR-3 bacterium]